VVLRVHNFKGHFYRLSIGPVHAAISPSLSTVRYRRKGLTIVLVKQDKKLWNRLLEDKNAKKVPTFDKKKEEDPSQSLMSMMKDLYDQGDDEMKRMMNKAWVRRRPLLFSRNPSLTFICRQNHRKRRPKGFQICQI
jgi:calcyclin binding protein